MIKGLAEIKKQGRIVLTEIEAKQVIEDAGIKVVATRLAESPEQAVDLSDAMGLPVVLKIASPDISHKTDAGGVKVGLQSAAEVKKAYAEIMKSVREKCPEADIQGVTVQKMARPGTEIIVGMHKDAQFGPVIMFGLGGIFVEVLKDVSFRLVPIVKRDAEEMIKEIRGNALLNGFRGREPAHLPSLVDVLLKLSAMVEKAPEIKEIDINPLFAYQDSAVAVDARIVLEE